MTRCYAVTGFQCYAVQSAYTNAGLDMQKSTLVQTRAQHACLSVVGRDIGVSILTAEVVPVHCPS